MIGPNDYIQVLAFYSFYCKVGMPSTFRSSHCQSSMTRIQRPGRQVRWPDFPPQFERSSPFSVGLPLQPESMVAQIHHNGDHCKQPKKNKPSWIMFEDP